MQLVSRAAAMCCPRRPTVLNHVSTGSFAVSGPLEKRRRAGPLNDSQALSLGASESRDGLRMLAISQRY
jgi:hypothetical protein